MSRPAPARRAYPPSLGEARYLSDAELAASLGATLERWDRTSDLWLFGYGSLIWNPGMPAVEALRAKVHGYHRGSTCGRA